MCILCHSDSLRLLVAPLRSLSHLDLTEAVGVAREAAMQVVLDTADAAGELEGAEAVVADLGAEVYVQYVVERAEQDGVAEASEVRAWAKAERSGAIYRDPRVQAFLSSTAEGLATYVMHIREHRLVLERYLEVAPEATLFAGIGRSGEVMFDHGDARYILLGDEEALQIAMDRLAVTLYEEDPARLLPYTNLPDGALEVLVAAQKKSEDEANDILAGIVDLRLLAEDLLRQGGYAQLVVEGVAETYHEQRFGDRVIIRTPIPEDDDYEA